MNLIINTYHYSKYQTKKLFDAKYIELICITSEINQLTKYHINFYSLSRSYPCVDSIAFHSYLPETQDERRVIITLKEDFLYWDAVSKNMFNIVDTTCGLYILLEHINKYD